MATRKQFKLGTAAFLVSASMMIAGCETTGSTAGIANRDLIGGGGGAAVGFLTCRALGGNNATCALVAAGGAVGGVIVARRLLKDDEVPRANALATVVNGAQASSNWRSADTGSSGTISSVGTSTGAAGEPCRTIEEVYTLRGSDPITEQFTVCQAEGGQWETVS